MKNVQIIDGATNCSYSIYEFSDEEFSLIFPEDGQDVEFIEDVIIRLGDELTGSIIRPTWKGELRKADICEIHGTLFYDLEFKKKFYPTKRSYEMTNALD